MIKTRERGDETILYDDETGLCEYFDTKDWNESSQSNKQIWISRLEKEVELYKAEMCEEFNN